MPRNTNDKRHKSIGSKIRELRIAAELSRMQLAAAMGVTHQQLQKYETGINRVSAVMLHDVSKIFGKPLEFFFDEEKPVEDPNKRKTLEIMRALAPITLKEKYVVHDLIKALEGLRNEKA